jgi:hypothetical protein
MDKFPEHDPRSGHQTTGQWYSQPQDIALADTPEFSQRFFAEVFKEFPTLATSVVFLRWSVGPDHLYAVFNFSSGGFACRLIRG